MEVKTRVLMWALGALVSGAALFAVGANVGYDAGIKKGVQEAYFCNALNTATYISALRGLGKGELAPTKRLLEVTANMGVLIMSSGKEQSVLAERTSKSVHDALLLVKQYRDEHPWSGPDQEIDSKVTKALASVDLQK